MLNTGGITGATVDANGSTASVLGGTPFSLTQGKFYSFKFFIPYSVGATTCLVLTPYMSGGLTGTYIAQYNILNTDPDTTYAAITNNTLSGVTGTTAASGDIYTATVEGVISSSSGTKTFDMFFASSSTNSGSSKTVSVYNGAYGILNQLN